MEKLRATRMRFKTSEKPDMETVSRDGRRFHADRPANVWIGPDCGG
jgi:hypothetical protein